MTIPQYNIRCYSWWAFGLFSVTNNAGMYTLVLIMFWCTYVCIFVRYILGMEFLGQNVWTHSPSVDIAKQVFEVLPFTFQPAVYKYSSCSIFSPTLGKLLNFKHLGGCVVASHCGFICFSLLTTEDEHLFTCLLSIRISSVMTNLFVFCSFSQWGFHLLFCMKFFYVLGTSPFLDICIANIFSMACLFHSINGIFWGAEAVKFYLKRPNLLIFSFMVSFMSCLRHICLAQSHENILWCNLEILFFRFLH